MSFGGGAVRFGDFCMIVYCIFDEMFVLQIDFVRIFVFDINLFIYSGLFVQYRSFYIGFINLLKIYYIVKP